MITLDNVKDYINQKGWTIISESTNNDETWLRLKKCPYCFVAGSLVMTDEGLLPIESLENQSRLVLTKSGILYPVLRFWKRKLDDDVLVDYYAYGMIQPATCTENHEIFVADKVNRRHAGGFVERKHKGFVTWYTGKIPATWLTRNEFKNNSIWVELPTIIPEYDYVVNDAYVLGLYCAEGHIPKPPHQREIVFSLHQKETNLVDKIRTYFGKCSIRYAKHSKAIQVSVFNVKFVPRFKECGEGAKNKRIPKDILFNSNITTLNNFINGLVDGDGYRRKDGLISLSTISPTLALQLSIIVRRLGYAASITYNDSKQENRQRSFSVSWRTDNKRMHPTVRQINNMWYGKLVYAKKKHQRHSMVYNLTIDTDHTYTINGSVVKNCLDEKGHFYLCSTGQYKCHSGSCGQAGTFYTLKKHCGDLVDVQSFKDLSPEEDKVYFQDEDISKIKAAHLRLLQDEEAKRYLGSRGFTLDAVKHFQLGLIEEDGLRWLAFPYWNFSRLKNVKLRTLPPAAKAFKRWKGGESSLYNESVLKNNYDSIIITEGETDCIALWSKGVRNVIGVSTGAGGIKPQWIKALDKYKRIYFIYDADAAGDLGSQKFANRLGIERCRQIKLPANIKDINDFFIQGKTIKDFNKLLTEAIKFDVENIISLERAIRKQIRESLSGLHNDVIYTPWNNVNKLINGLVPGDLITIAAKPGVGKTSLSLNILMWNALQGNPVLLFSLEMPLWRLLPRLVALVLRKDSTLCQESSVLLQAYELLKEVPFYFAYKYDKPTWNFIADTVRSAVKYYGIKLLVFDNLHFMVRSLNKQTEEVSMMIQNFKLLAEELAIPIVVIARPRKTNNKIISGEDIKDSADVEGDSDLIIILSRDRKKSMSGEEVEGVFDPKTLITINKARYSRGGSTFLIAHDAEARFDSLG